MHRFRGILERYLILWLCASSGAFLIWGQNDPNAASTLNLLKVYTMQPSIMLAMFCVGFLIPVEELKHVISDWYKVLFGTLTQYATMPLLAFGVAELMGFQDTTRAGIILVGCVPGAMASNVLTLTARGNVSYSICVTTLSTILSPIAVPLLLSLLLQIDKGPEPLAVFTDLLRTVALPVLAGFGLKVRLKLYNERLLEFAAILANLMILWVIAVAIGLNADRLRAVTGPLLAALLTLNLAGYAAGWFSGRLQRLDLARQKALILEVGMQNAGVGTMLALTFFEDTTTAIPPAVYTFGCMLTGTLLASIWHWRATTSKAATEDVSP